MIQSHSVVLKSIPTTSSHPTLLSLRQKHDFSKPWASFVVYASAGGAVESWNQLPSHGNGRG